MNRRTGCLIALVGIGAFLGVLWLVNVFLPIDANGEVAQPERGFYPWSRGGENRW